MRATIFVGCLLGFVGMAGEAFGQPVLDRVERFLRDQVGAAQPVPQPAPAQPTPALPGDQPKPVASGSDTGYLGLTADDRQDLGRGVRIVAVTPGGPASQAGLLNGDLIVSIDGAPVRMMDDMGRALTGKPAGTRVALTVNRVGAERRHEVTLGQRPQSRVIGQPVTELPPPQEPQQAATQPTQPARPRLGVRTIPVADPVRQQNNLPPGRGAAVVFVTPGSPADRAGIPVGAVITAVGSEEVFSPEGLAAAIGRAGDEIELTILDRGQQSQRSVSLTAFAEPRLELRGRPTDSPVGAVPPAGAVPGPSPTPAAAEPSTLQTAPSAADAPTPMPDKPAPEKPVPNPPGDEPSRIEDLEARIRDLEARVEKLEAAASAPKEPAPADTGANLPAETAPAEPPAAETSPTEAEAPK